MKETKVYVDKLPESCAYCPCCSCDLKPEFIKIGDIMYCNLLKQKFRFKEERKKLKDCPLQSLKTHDREKDKRIKELEQKVQELQEVDNKRAFRLYCMLYDMLEEKDPENVASRIEYMTSENYADICEMYKTAKNIKQHDKELVAKVLESVKNEASKDGFYDEDGNKIITYHINNYILDQIAKEFEDEQ